MPTLKYAFLVPVYRHGSALGGVIDSLVKYNFPIIVVDDGNGDEDKTAIRAVKDAHPEMITVVAFDKNRGKGKACNAGVLAARDMGVTHVFQVDSDGQHDTEVVPRFLELSRGHPEALILGVPRYDESAPSLRLNGRRVARVWAHIVTLSGTIEDPLIGFRIYPVAPYVKLLSHHAVIDSRMAYDIDILVHLFWAGVEIVSEPVKVSYPKDGVSNFRNVRDNARISACYARLFIGMIFRSPVLVYRALTRRTLPAGAALPSAEYT